MTTRLTATQLRTIIKEEVAAVLAEAAPPADFNSVVDAAVAAFVDAAPFDSSDPSMSPGGEASWDDQVETAAEELRNAVSDVLDEIVQKLYDGVYAR